LCRAWHEGERQRSGSLATLRGHSSPERSARYEAAGEIQGRGAVAAESHGPLARH